MRSQLLFLLAVFIILSCQKDPGKLMAAKPITIFAAASTGPALQEIRTYLQMHEQLDLRIHVAASSLLAQQIRAGAPCDLVLLAETSWMIELAAQKKNCAGIANEFIVQSFSDYFAAASKNRFGL